MLLRATSLLPCPWSFIEAGEGVFEILASLIVSDGVLIILRQRRLRLACTPDGGQAVFNRRGGTGASLSCHPIQCILNIVPSFGRLAMSLHNLCVKVGDFAWRFDLCQVF